MGPRRANDRPRGTERLDSRRVGHDIPLRKNFVAYFVEILGASNRTEEPTMRTQTQVTLDRTQREAIRGELELRSNGWGDFGAPALAVTGGA